MASNQIYVEAALSTKWRDSAEEQYTVHKLYNVHYNYTKTTIKNLFCFDLKQIANMFDCSNFSPLPLLLS